MLRHGTIAHLEGTHQPRSLDLRVWGDPDPGISPNIDPNLVLPRGYSSGIGVPQNGTPKWTQDLDRGPEI
jgi:hypothetical protein